MNSGCFPFTDCKAPCSQLPPFCQIDKMEALCKECDVRVPTMGDAAGGEDTAGDDAPASPAPASRAKRSSRVSFAASSPTSLNSPTSEQAAPVKAKGKKPRRG